MTFTVTYRDKSGLRVQEAFEAESRSELFAQLKERKINALRIDSGKPKVTRSSTVAISPKFLKLIAALLAVAVCAVVVITLLPTKSDVKNIEVVKEKPKKKAETLTTTTAPETIAKKDEPVPQVTPEKPKHKPPAWRNPNLTPEERTAAYEKSLDKPLSKDQPTNRVFRTGVEQMMDWVFSVELGEMPMPLPRIPDVDYVKLKEILESKNTILDTDSDRVAQSKETVDYAKKIFKEFIDKGGEPDDFLAYYHDELKAAWQTRQVAQNEVMKILQTEPELAQEYLDKVNASLAEKGIKRVIVPERILSRLGITLNQEPLQQPNPQVQGENR